MRPASVLPDFDTLGKDDFWAYLEKLVSSSRVVVDRPKDTPHPRYSELIYPMDYGYLEGTTSMDGGGIDVWIGSNPDRALDGVLLTIDLKKKDAEVKILLGCTVEDQGTILAFLNDHAMRAILINRQSRGKD